MLLNLFLIYWDVQFLKSSNNKVFSWLLSDDFCWKILIELPIFRYSTDHDTNSLLKFKIELNSNCKRLTANQGGFRYIRKTSVLKVTFRIENLKLYSRLTFLVWDF